jgi:hypothetical protein
VSDLPDTDGDGVPDVDDPTPLMDVMIVFDGVERVTTEVDDSLRYELIIGNNGPDGAASTVVAITPPDGVLITEWNFGSWTVEGQPQAAVLFGFAAATSPVCWLDAFVLRCELGTVANGWEIPLEIEVDVYDDPGDLEARASIVALGFDTELGNNTNKLSVASKTSLAEAIPAALAFTGLHLGLMWWIVIAIVLMGGGVVLLGAGRRRSTAA